MPLPLPLHAPTSPTCPSHFPHMLLPLSPTCSSHFPYMLLLPLHAPPTSPTCSSHFPYMPLLFPTPYINLPLLKLLCHAHLCPPPLHTARDCYNLSTYFNVSTGDCQPCDPTCVTCKGPLPYPDPTSGCTDCSVVLMTGATYQVRGVVMGGAVPCEGAWSRSLIT